MTFTEVSKWGLHTIIDISGADLDSISNECIISTFCEVLCDEILGMKRYGPPFIKRFGEGNKFGYTLLQPIETSAIMAHFAEDSKSIYLDVFSCKGYDPDMVVDYTIDTFGGELSCIRVMSR